MSLAILSMRVCPAARLTARGWQHDGSSSSPDRLSFGTCFVTCGIVVHLPFCTRPVCLPVLARLVLGGTTKVPARRRKGKKAALPSGTKVSAAVGLVTLLATAGDSNASTRQINSARPSIRQS